MNTRTTIRSPGAIALGAFFAAVTGYTLFSDVIGGASINTSHVLALAALVAAIASGHMAWPALRSGHIGPAILLVVLFLGSTSYVVVSSGARNAETAGNKAATIAASNEARARETKKLAQAEAMLGEAQKNLATECASGKGKRCDGVRATINVYEAAIKGHQATLKELAPPLDANGGYAHAAKVLVAAGVPGTASEIEARLVLLLPFVTVLIAELGTIAFLHLGLGHDCRPATQHQTAAAVTAEAPKPVPPKGGKRSKRSGKPGRKGDPKVVAFAVAYKARHGRAPTGSEIKAAFPSLPKSTAYDYAKRAA